MCIIQVHGLTKTFDTKIKAPGFSGSFQSMFRPQFKSVNAVDHVDFNVEQGEMLAFIGPNGAGKSTTIKMLTGILQPSEGSIDVMGYHPMNDRQSMSYHIGTVFGQKSQLWFHLPPEDSFRLLGKLYEIDDHTLKKRIAYLNDVFDIHDLLNIPVRKMSLGQRIRCEIAASLLHEPKIIFLDEPTIGLDVIVKQKIRDLIKTVNQEEKTTIFLTSHDAGDIDQLCKRVIVINHGNIVTDDTTANIKREYLGSKILKVKYAEKVILPKTQLPITPMDDYSIEVALDTRIFDIHDIITQLITYGKVLDITIEDPPLEEIIASIYQRKKEVHE